ncbi:hypothetical protein JCGZ_22817 [Jatropha curcas]|uniref:Uncharacterized protein n=1 Tax=Jatropha curcas TaxID=180498 RepID=A0A067LFK3_JATCU|nr:hypothetical protein JCGZ_22817 [Jatropha curcas]
MEKTPAPAVENVEGAGTSTNKLMPTPLDVSALDPQAAAILTQAYNDFTVVLQMLMARPVTQFPPEGRRQINIVAEGENTANKTVGEKMEEEDSSWHTETQGKT